MSDPIKHECGIALVRLKKPLNYYKEKYGTPYWGLNRLFLLMEKQRNRGQDGVGVGVGKLDVDKGNEYFSRIRKSGQGALEQLWKQIHTDISAHSSEKDLNKQKVLNPWLGEMLLGHLRYGTHSGNSSDLCHPFERFSNWPTRRLMVAGNFNLTNTNELINMLMHLGQHPVGSIDTSTVMEKIGHFLDVANDSLVRKGKAEGISGPDLIDGVAKQLDISRVLRHSAKHWDGGYLMAGMTGHGLGFALRDPHGIRPGWYFENEEVIAVASERAALITCFNLDSSMVVEVPPGHALLMNQIGETSIEKIIEPAPEPQKCKFERIYFSRGNDEDIYQERKALGRKLVPSVLKAVNYDTKNTVFSYVPNTAEVSYYGLVDGLNEYVVDYRKDLILKAHKKNELTEDVLDEILSRRVRTEKVVLKDAKLRTFISDESGRGDLVRHAYDITRGIVKPGIDNLVVIDDSIVRGTTLRESILSMLSRTAPKSIIVVSSAPQIRYPDCYGIDMSELGKFIAFEAAVMVLKESGQESVLQETYEDCKKALKNNVSENAVKKIYKSLSNDQISDKIAELIRPEGLDWSGEIRVIYQNIEDLREAIPNHGGDWYFSGEYPTIGGYKVVNQAFVNYMEKKHGRSY